MGNDIDYVNSPPHYAGTGKMECIDAIEGSMSTEAFEGFLKGQVMKYLWRCGRKRDPTMDLEKASWYLNRLLEIVKNGEAEG